MKPCLLRKPPENVAPNTPSYLRRGPHALSLRAVERRYCQRTARTESGDNKDKCKR